MEELSYSFPPDAHTLSLSRTNQQNEPREVARERDSKRPGRAFLRKLLEQANASSLIPTPPGHLVENRSFGKSWSAI